MLKRTLHSSFQIIRILNPNTFHTHGLSNHRKVRIYKLCPGLQESGSFHLQFNKTECPIIKHHDFNRQIMLFQCQQITHQHRNTTITRQRDDLSARISDLSANCLRQSVCHRTMTE
ncbi:hypothetical protein D3C76_1349020 [compost metagenome]